MQPEGRLPFLSIEHEGKLFSRTSEFQSQFRLHHTLFALLHEPNERGGRLIYIPSLLAAANGGNQLLSRRGIRTPRGREGPGGAWDSVGRGGAGVLVQSVLLGVAAALGCCREWLLLDI